MILQYCSFTHQSKQDRQTNIHFVMFLVNSALLQLHLVVQLAQLGAKTVKHLCKYCKCNNFLY